MTVSVLCVLGQLLLAIESNIAPKIQLHLCGQKLTEQAPITLVRQKTFELKSTSNGIYIDAQKIFIDKKNLNVSLRLWKLEGWGNWWRDYDIQCPILIENDELTLGEPIAELTEKSEGAGFADPISLLAEGYILETIKKQIQ